jgi:hypothetical protein
LDDHGVICAGRDDFVAWAVETHRRDAGSTQHLIGSHSCELDGDTAHAETHYFAMVKPKAGEAVTFAGGRWLDRFERRDGGWRIAARKCIPEWAGTPVWESVPELSRRLMELTARPQRDRSDPSYNRPLVIDPARVGVLDPAF